MSIAVTEIADLIEGTSAEGVLLDLPFTMQAASFCFGADWLEELGLMDCDGRLSSDGVAVRDILAFRRASRAAGEGAA